MKKGRKASNIKALKCLILLSSFLTACSPSNEKQMERNLRQAVYPDCYGGTYLNEFGKQVVLATDTSSEAKEHLAPFVESTDFTLKKCTYSFNRLCELNEWLGLFFEDPQLCEELTWEGSGIDVKANCIVISLKDCSPESIARFRQKVLDSPMFRFEAIGNIQWDSARSPK